MREPVREGGKQPFNIVMSDFEKTFHKVKQKTQLSCAMDCTHARMSRLLHVTTQRKISCYCIIA